MIVPLLFCCLAPALSIPQSEPEKLIAAGHWKRARAIVEPRIHSQPNDPLANFMLSQIRNAFGDRQSPLPLAEKAVQLDAHTAKYHRQLAEVLGVTAQYSNMFRQLFLARRFKKEIDIALSLDTHDLQALRDLMEFYILAPGIAGGDKDQARAIADRIEHIDIAAGCSAKARLAVPDQREPLLRKAVEAEPANYRARIELANLYLDRRDYAQAAQQATAALNLDRARVDAYNILAAAHAARAAWSALDTLLATAEKEVPDDLTPYYRAAQHSDPEHARRLLQKYLSAEPEGNAPTLADARKLAAH